MMKGTSDPVTPAEARAAVLRMNKKARSKRYKLIRIGELLHEQRVRPDAIDVLRPETYLTRSRELRDIVSRALFGTVSRSNREWEDLLIPRRDAAPLLTTLIRENHRIPAQVEAFIYGLIGSLVKSVRQLIHRCTVVEQGRFSVAELLAHCRNDEYLRRQMPSFFEILAYAVCATLVEALHIDVALTMATKPFRTMSGEPTFRALFESQQYRRSKRVRRGRLERVSIANAADGGLDIVGNFGLSVQVKYCVLNAELVEAILRATAVDDLVIVCRSIAPTFRDSCQTDTRIRGVITEADLIQLTNRIVAGDLGPEVERALRQRIVDELRREFPAVDPDRFDRFLRERGYDVVPKWVVAA